MKSFDIASPITDADREQLNMTPKAKIRAVASGERRPPRTGEWFLVFVREYGQWLAFKAAKDLEHNAPIAELVPKKTVSA